jgi:hypothetical protein
MNHYKCDRCGVIVETEETHTDLDVALCPGCYTWLLAKYVPEPCNTCGNTGRWQSTTEDSPTELVDLGPCPDCGLVQAHPSFALFCIECGSTLDEQGLCIACQPPSGDDYPEDGVPFVTESLLPEQTIYFDPDDEWADGNGWNVVDDGSVAARFPTLVDAMGWCESQGLPYRFRPSVVTVPRKITSEEVVALNESLKGWGK